MYLTRFVLQAVGCFAHQCVTVVYEMIYISYVRMKDHYSYILYRQWKHRMVSENGAMK